MKVCFFGLGSIGKRHLTNLRKICKERDIELEVHAYRNSINSPIVKGVNKDIYKFEDLSDDYHIVFITNPNSEHFKIIKLLSNKCKNMFIEKPLFDNINYNLEELNFLNGVYYVAAPLRYTGIVGKLKEIISDKKVYSVRAICSSYLPDWRPNQDYREVYSSKKELGGGVSIDLIHEWDYLSYLFGFPEKIYNFQGKHSHLEINSEDLSIYIAKYSDKLIELHLDYFGRESRREIELFTEKGTIIGDFIKKEIRFSWKNEKIDFLENGDLYINEMNNFLDMIEGKKENNNTIKHAYSVLKLIKETENL